MSSVLLQYTILDSQYPVRQQISRAYSFHLTEMCLLINNSPFPTTPKTLVTTILVIDFMNLTTLGN